MPSARLEALGLALGLVGWLGGIVCCVLPTWRVTPFVAANTTGVQSVWEGLWMNCFVQGRGVMQCQFYELLWTLPRDLQAAQALTLTSAALCAPGLLLGIAGAQCTTCLGKASAKAAALLASGALFALAGLALLVPVSWVAHDLLRAPSAPLWPPIPRRGLGAALYLGWASSAALLLGGGLLLCSRWLGRARK